MDSIKVFKDRKDQRVRDKESNPIKVVKDGKDQREKESADGPNKGVQGWEGSEGEGQGIRSLGEEATPGVSRTRDWDSLE
ncbi:hypothetical protein WISP_49257 [Willisornis vidua]|uniref:Uncharacterized protein n=1 Tax=Willisornis vidua TaxID=1566151 RepID=A0ABQ9DEW4_9PASS|nr:hypothetical protein WISP_49257 [Willisornis vidua]